MAKRPSIEVDADPAFQEGFWKFQRVAWVVMALIILAALFGATGSGGPLAHAQVEGPAGRIDYPRIARWQAADQMKVTVPPTATGSATLELDAAFTQTFSIEDIEPQPRSSLATATGHRFEFELGDAPGEKSIIFHLRADRPAWPTGLRARLGEAPPMTLRMTVLP